MTSRSGRVGVIGGGLGGLAAACTLAARGYDVILFERGRWLGGKAAVLQGDGFRFDMGPTILTLPSVLRRIFAEAGRKLEDALSLVRLDPQWRSFFSDGTTLDLAAEPAAMSRRLDSFAPGSGDGYRRFLDLSARQNDVSQRYFFWRSVGGLRDMFSTGSLLKPSLLTDMLSLRPGRSVAATVRSFVPDARVAQMLDHFTQYVGSAPDLSPAVLCGIAHMQTDEGVWYPVGGTGAVPRALADLARSLGVEVRTGCGVRRVLVKDGAVEGLLTDAGERMPLAAVVSNADAVRTHRDMLGGPPAERFERRRSYEPACSGVVLYLGLRHRYDHLLHHNFVFSHSPQEEFEFVYRRGEPAPDPTCYVCAPAATEPDVAPPGGEALYVLVHTPYLRPHHDWAKMLPAFRRVILRKLAATAGLTDLGERIRFERWLTPQDIHERYGVLNGAIYGLASHGLFAGAFKPANRSPDVAGLYLAGGAAHPGPGMPMVLMSGWIAADTLDRDGVVKKGVGGGRRAADGEAPPSPPAVRRPPAALPRRSPLLVKWFLAYVRRYLRRHFHGVRLSRAGGVPDLPAGPLLVVLNHPSWWDPLVCAALSELFPHRPVYAPIEGAMLGRYPLLGRLGFFGVEPAGARGARDFLRTGGAVLSAPENMLWVTAQGEFTDARRRPAGLRPGVAHLIRRLSGGTVLPLALEYAFWDESRPEALARFGSPIPIGDGRSRTVAEWLALIEGELTVAQDALAAEAQARDAAAFESLLEGVAGVGGVYDLWRRLRALLRGEQFRREHRPLGDIP